MDTLSIPTSPNRAANLAVLGAGLCGRLIAWRALQAGCAVDLFELRAQEDERGAAFAAAAMISPLAESAGTECFFGELGVAALPIWQTYLAHLASATASQPKNNPSIFFQQAGTLVVAHPRDRALQQNFWAQLQEVRSKWQGADPCPAFFRLEGEALSSQEPALSGRFNSAIMLTGEGQIDNLALLLQLQTLILALGGNIHWQTPMSANELIQTSRYSAIIDCRGVGAKTQWRGNGNLRGVRGEVMRVHLPEISLNRPIRLLHPRYPLYIAPKPHQEFVIGATVIESEDESPISVQSAMELQSALYAVHPGFAEARILAQKTALRPTLEDHRPRIIVDLPHRLWQINGLSRHGYMIAPIVVESALASIGQNLKIPLSFLPSLPFPTLFATPA